MKKNTPHTPGPYGLWENRGTAFMVITHPDKDGIRIVGLAVNDANGNRQEELEATAALFKAAPDLLAALELAVDGCGYRDGVPEAYRVRILAAARAALAKARGKF